MTTSHMRRAARRALAGDRGAGAAETVAATPLLMLLILLVVQFGIWADTTHAAQATAEQALAAARVQGGTTGAGQQQARQLLAHLAGAVLVSPHITVTRTATTATVHITATAERVLPLPGIALPVTVTVTGPTERFIPPSR